MKAAITILALTQIAAIGQTRYPYDSPDLAAKLHSRISAIATETSAPYSEVIAGTDVKFDMVPIPAGHFRIGSPNEEKGRKADEGPQKEVAIEPFWMGKTEVTWDELLVFMDPVEDKHNRSQIPAPLVESTKISDELAHPSEPYTDMAFGMGSKGYPAVNVTQHMANKYCQWLSARTGHFYRLPTEAEWEYAARAGTTTAYYWGDDASKFDDFAWWGKNADFKYHKVGKKKPNPWGLYDMIGNVAEWTLDQYDAGYYATMPSANPWNTATRPYPHSVRGGSWNDDDITKLRSASRAGSTPEWKREDPRLPKSYWYFRGAPFVGFRVVRPVKLPTAAEMQKYWNSGVAKDDPKMEEHD